jgi:hypothetical protein
MLQYFAEVDSHELEGEREDSEGSEGEDSDEEEDGEEEDDGEEEEDRGDVWPPVRTRDIVNVQLHKMLMHVPAYKLAQIHQTDIYARIREIKSKIKGTMTTFQLSILNNLKKLAQTSRGEKELFRDCFKSGKIVKLSAELPTNAMEVWRDGHRKGIGVVKHNCSQPNIRRLDQSNTSIEDDYKTNMQVLFPAFHKLGNSFVGVSTPSQRGRRNNNSVYVTHTPR